MRKVFDSKQISHGGCILEKLCIHSVVFTDKLVQKLLPKYYSELHTPCWREAANKSLLLWESNTYHQKQHWASPWLTWTALSMSTMAAEVTETSPSFLMSPILAFIFKCTKTNSDDEVLLHRQSISAKIGFVQFLPTELRQEHKKKYCRAPTQPWWGQPKQEVNNRVSQRPTKHVFLSATCPGDS